MYMYTCVWLIPYIFEYMCTFMNMYVPKNPNIYTLNEYVGVLGGADAHMRVCVHVYVHRYVYMCIYMYMYIHIYMYTYIYIYAYTHIYT